MKTQHLRKENVFVLSLFTFLERGSYYGMRAVLVLYLVADNGLELSNDEAFKYFNQLVLLIGILPLIMGVVIDLVFKQKKGVLLGSLIAFTGYSLLLINDINIIRLSIILIALGTSLIKPSISILMGRLFDKSDHKRDMGYMMSYLAANIGSFLYVVQVGMIGESYGWNISFAIVAITALLYLVLFYFYRNRLKLIEVNISQSQNDQLHKEILDAPIKTNKRYHSKAISLILILTCISAFFWQGYDTINSHFYAVIAEFESLNILSFEVPRSLFYSFSSFFTFLVMIGLIIYWYIKGTGSSLKKIAYAILLMGGAALLISNIDSTSQNSFLVYASLGFLLLSFAEVFITPILFSYITRLSDVNYSSTIYGAFVFILYLISKLFDAVPITSGTSEELIIGAIISIMIGAGLWLSQKQLLKLSGGLN